MWSAGSCPAVITHSTSIETASMPSSVDDLTRATTQRDSALGGPTSELAISRGYRWAWPQGVRDVREAAGCRSLHVLIRARFLHIARARSATRHRHPEL